MTWIVRVVYSFLAWGLSGVGIVWFIIAGGTVGGVPRIPGIAFLIVGLTMAWFSEDVDRAIDYWGEVEQW